MGCGITLEPAIMISHCSHRFLNHPVTGQLINILTRDRLCESIGISPEQYIDTLGWAMNNPSEPILVDNAEAECFENRQETVDITQLPNPSSLATRQGSLLICECHYSGGQRHSQHVFSPSICTRFKSPCCATRATALANNDDECSRGRT